MTDVLARLNDLLAGRYRLERELGAGGMGTVYLADDLRHARRVAVKVLRPDLTATLGAARFLEEARVTATLQHPNILPLFDSGEAGGLLFYVMPFVAGESLRERLTREGKLPAAEAARILRDVVDGLAAAHQQGIVHRDIKPENILLSGRHALVADFGIAKTTSTTSVAPQRTTAGVALGTPTYMAPEQIAADADVDSRADLYAVGAVAYEMLTGRPPFTGRGTPQLFLAHLNEAPKPIAEHDASIPPELAALVMRCLEKRPADRWQHAEEMLPHLDAIAAGLQTKLPTPSGPGSTVRLPQVRRRRALLASAGLAITLAVVWGIATVGRSRTDDDRPVASRLPRLVVMPLLSITGDSEEAQWGRRAASAVARAIDSTGAVDLVPEVAVQEAEGAGAAAATEIARRTSASHAAAGTVTLSEGRLELKVEIIDLRSGTPHLMHRVGPVSGPIDSADAVVARLASRSAVAVVLLFRGINLALSAERTPTVPEVIGYLERASEFGCDRRFDEASRELHQALAIDPGYVPAIGTLAYIASTTGNWRTADSLGKVLDGLRGRMLTGEKLWWDYQRSINGGDWAAATTAAEAGYQRDPQTWGHLAGFVALSTRRVAEALDRLAAARPASGCYLPQAGVYRLRSEALHLLARYEDELAEARRFLSRYPGNALAYESALRALAAMGMTPAVDSVLAVLAAAPPQPGLEPVWGPIRTALELRAHGHGEHAERLMERLYATYSALPAEVSAEDRALVAFFAGRWTEAAPAFARLARGAADSASLLRYQGVALARLGRREEALAIRERLGRITSRTHGQSSYYRAVITAALGDAPEATFLLEQAFRSGYGFDARYHRDPWWDPVRGDEGFRALVQPR